VHGSIDLDLRAPETMADVSSWDKFRKVQPPPVMESNTTELAQHNVRLMLPMRPQFGYLMGEFGVG